MIWEGGMGSPPVHLALLLRFRIKGPELSITQGHTTRETVRRYVHYASNRAMIQGHVSPPADKMGIKKLRGYKIAQMLRKNDSCHMEKAR